jgi:predicted nucleic acid-binding protein
VKVFLDSNVVLYGFSRSEAIKGPITRRLLAAPVPASISTQVLNECSQVLRRKWGYSPREVGAALDELIGLTDVRIVDVSDIRRSWALADRYGYSHYDCVILAAALSSGCGLLYSEDMQHGQLIEDRLTILNPYLIPTPS